MIYECTGGHTVDDDKDVGTLIGENWYCEGCLSKMDLVHKLASIYRERSVLDLTKSKEMISLVIDEAIEKYACTHADSDRIIYVEDLLRLKGK